MKSCRTASTVAFSALGAMAVVAACRDAERPEVPPLTTAKPDGKPVLGPSNAAVASDGSEGGAIAPAVNVPLEPPVKARVLDAPAKLEASLCQRVLVAVVKGKIAAMNETLAAGDVLVVTHGEAFDATGSGTVVWAGVAIPDCAVLSRPSMTKAVVRAGAATKLEWAKGTMSARLPYMAPELLRDEPVSQATDVWSIATCLWELLAGERLFSGPNNFQTIQNVVSSRTVPTLADRRSDVPAWLDRILGAALQRDAKARTQTAAEMKMALEREAAIAGLSLDLAFVSSTVRSLFADVIEKHRSLVQSLIENKGAVTAEDLGRVREQGAAQRPTSLASVRPKRLLVPPDALDDVSPPPAAVRAPAHAVPIVPPSPDRALRPALDAFVEEEHAPRPSWHWAVLGLASAGGAVAIFELFFR